MRGRVGRIGPNLERGPLGSKYFSLTASRSTPPFGVVTYRYGTAQHVELEYSAPRDGVFYREDQFDHPTGAVGLFFQKNGFTYMVSQHYGMSILSEFDAVITVHKGGQQMMSVYIADETGSGFQFDELKGRCVINRRADFEW